MYQPLYYLNKAPFQASIDPDYFWWRKNSEKILNHLRSDLEQHGRLTLVTGRPGSGKTTLISKVLAELAPQVLVAMISDPRLTIEEFYDLTAYALLLPGRCKNRQQFHEQIQALVRKAGEEKRHVLLVIDEAQQLSPELIEELQKVIELFSSKSKRLSVCLVGQLEDTDGTQGPIIKGFRNHGLVLHHLEPLTPDETGKYIQHRLKVAGGHQKIFTDDAFREIHQFSGGYPGRINIICDVALFIGSTVQAGAIDAALIRSNTEKFQFTNATHRSTGKTRPVKSGGMVYQGNDDIDRSECDDEDDGVAGKPHGAASIAVDNTPGQKRVPKRTGAPYVLGWLFVLVLGGGGYVYYASSTVDPAEFSAGQLTEDVEIGAELSAEQMTEVLYLANEQIQAAASPDQVGGSLEIAGGFSVNEALVGMQEESDQPANSELANILKYGDGGKTDFEEIHASDSNELLLPQLQEEILTVLQEATQQLLLERQDSTLPDTEEITVVDLGPLDAVQDDGSRGGEAASPVGEERAKLKSFLAAGSFDVVTTPAQRETEDPSNIDRPEVTFPAQERIKEEVEPDPERIIDWLLEEKKARNVQ